MTLSGAGSQFPLLIATMAQYVWQLAFYDKWVAPDGHLYALPANASSDGAKAFLDHVLRRIGRASIWTAAGLIGPQHPFIVRPLASLAWGAPKA